MLPPNPLPPLITTEMWFFFFPEDLFVILKHYIYIGYEYVQLLFMYAIKQGLQIRNQTFEKWKRSEENIVIVDSGHSVVSSAYCYHYYSYYYHHKSNRTVFTPRDSIS